MKPIAVTLPDETKVHSTHMGDLCMPHLSKAARLCHIVPGLASYSLISVVKLCNAGCNVSFTKFGIGVEVRCRGNLVLTGSKFNSTSMWMVPLNTTETHTTTTPSKQLQYDHPPTIRGDLLDHDRRRRLNNDRYGCHGIIILTLING